MLNSISPAEKLIEVYRRESAAASFAGQGLPVNAQPCSAIGHGTSLSKHPRKRDPRAGRSHPAATALQPSDAMSGRFPTSGSRYTKSRT